MLVGLPRGMDVAATYTPLECLLVFRSLVALGTEEEDFISISELLKKSPLVRDCPTYDAKRLEASALRDLYLRLLRDELRSEEQNGIEDTNKSPSRKRKLPSPKLASFNDCRQYKHKLPLLVERLYGRYRDYMIKAIEEDERKYVKLQGQIKKIEKEDWDQSMLEEDEDLESNDKSEPIPPKNVVLLESSNPKHGSNVSRKPTLKLSSSDETRQLELSHNCNLNSFECNSFPKTKAQKSRTGNQTALGQKLSLQKQLPLSNSSSQNQKELSKDNLYRTPGQISPPPYVYPENNASQLTPQIHAESPQKPSSRSPAVYLSQNSSPLASSTSKNLRNEKSSSKPTKIPGKTVNVHKNTFNQELHTSSEKQLTSPCKNTPKNKISVPEKSPSPFRNNQHDKDKTLPFRSSKTSPVFPETKQLSPSRPLIKPKKIYTSPYDKEKAHKLLTPIQISSLNLNKNKVSHKAISTEPLPPKNKKSVTGYGTTWNPTPTGLTPRNFTPLSPPKMEPLSPIDKPSGLALIENILEEKFQERESSCPLKSPRNDSPCSSPSKTDLEIAFTPCAGQSLEIPIANKKPLVNNPIDSDVEIKFNTLPKPQSIDNTTADKVTAREPSKNLLSPKSPSKLKQETQPFNKSQAPATVLWTRAFPRIAAQALQDISTDKNASMFANPIKEKDAPGYRNIILRPQDLKSIRIAITAGHRAALAAAPDDLKSNATSVWLPISEELIPPKGIINYAQLEKELMRMFANAIMFNADPRRGFVPLWQDAAERYKEGAFGYSFDEDSVVKGTRDMFAAVEKKVSDLRSVERKREKSWEG
ncbi:putative wd domain containing protein [Erysiphe necator]|uniref:Putative wd domain containing protein n=1 Tax=Uncinula necator TaxID=52586 RepID=A0A0B1PGK7_UNCNE|nr:putative wd domain containing protein [Erysiphe necator]